MALSIFFWVLMLLWVIFQGWSGYDPARPFFRWGAPYLVLFVLLAILGWGVFGPPINSNDARPQSYQQRR